jgi:Tol biopolymer transport system component
MTRRVLFLAAICIAAAVLGGQRLLTSRSDAPMESRWNYYHGGPFQPGTPSLSPSGHEVLCDPPSASDHGIYRANCYGTNLTRLTLGSRLERHPVYSFDGKRIAFSRRTGGYEHIWLMGEDGANQVQLTRGRVLDWASSFSGDGSRLFFIRTSWRGRALLPEREMFCISLSSARPSIVERIGPACSISSNGTVFVFTHFDPRKHQTQIWSLNRETGITALLGFGYSPAISPDGQTVACLPLDLQHDSMILMKTIGGEPTKVPVPYGPKTPPEFCLTGHSVIFRVLPSERGGAGGIYLLSLDALKVEKLNAN